MKSTFNCNPAHRYNPLRVSCATRDTGGKTQEKLKGHTHTHTHTHTHVHTLHWVACWNVDQHVRFARRFSFVQSCRRLFFRFWNFHLANCQTQRGNSFLIASFLSKRGIALRTKPPGPLSMFLSVAGCTLLPALCRCFLLPAVCCRLSVGALCCRLSVGAFCCRLSVADSLSVLSVAGSLLSFASSPSVLSVAGCLSVLAVAGSLSVLSVASSLLPAICWQLSVAGSLLPALCRCSLLFSGGLCAACQFSRGRGQARCLMGVRGGGLRKRATSGVLYCLQCLRTLLCFWLGDKNRMGFPASRIGSVCPSLETLQKRFFHRTSSWL